MNREEAQFLLSAVRPDRINQNDPEITEALRLLDRDPELRCWFEASSRFDRAISDRLAEVLPPPDLRDSILAGIRVSRPPRWRRRSTVLLATAACFVLGFLFTWFLKLEPSQTSDGGRATVAEFESGMLEAIASLDSLDHHSSDPADIVSWLQEHGTTSAPNITSGAVSEAKDHKFAGCKIIDWRGYKVSLICLRKLEGGEGMPDLHLVTVPAEAIEGFFKDDVIAHFPDKETAGNGWSTAMWQSGEFIHLVVAEGKHSDPRLLVPFG